MPIINLASTEQEALDRGSNVQRIDCNHDGKVIMWTYETHHGLCISDRERNSYDDSDWYMLIWDAEKQEPFEICFATTRGWAYPCYGSQPDATFEVMAAYNAWVARRDHNSKLAADRIAAKTPAPGKLVEVIAGRKFKRGSQFEVRSVEKSAFGLSQYGTWDNRDMIAYCYQLDSEGRRDISQALAVIPFKNLAVVDPAK